MPNSNRLPYDDVFYPLLKCIHNALEYCYTYQKKRRKINGQIVLPDESDESLNVFFADFELFYRKGTNKHLSKGLSRNAQVKSKDFPRLAKLTIQAFRESQQISKNSNFKGFVLPSPLYILFSALIVPSEPQTSAYSLVLCRSMLFHFLELYPFSDELVNKENFEVFDESDVLESIASFRNYVRIQARWPDGRPREDIKKTFKVNFLVGQFLALKGVAHFWFSSENQLMKFCRYPNSITESKLKKRYSNPEYRFRLSDNFVELPDPGEIINSIFGIPLPFRGGETLFFGGLKKSSDGGAVINLNGKPGAGKTSVALSWAALLSPLNTTCVYISLEEKTQDLYSRLLTLIPEYLKELSIYRKPKGLDQTDWFFPYQLKDIGSFEEVTELLNLLDRDLRQSAISTEQQTYLPAVCPALIVIDNINELVVGYEGDHNAYKQLEKFIISCRKLGAIVVLISAEEISKKISIDYLVDTSIQLTQSGTEDVANKPLRIFKLNKTRHQVSRQGSHVFHLSGPDGFRICPQIPSQMDKKENLKRLLPDKSQCMHTLNLQEGNKEVTYNSFLRIFPTSQILVHGLGSSGKAGFALKLLLTPPVKNMIPSPQNLSDLLSIYNTGEKIRRKVLVISFLYPPEYYQLLSKKITGKRNLFYDKQQSPLEILSFYPGYLAPEDFINKIVRYLDEAIYEGEPYTGVLLDGLHNVFLQFKNLQENDMVWPLLYGILTRYNVTTVSTFTNFHVNNHTDIEAGFAHNFTDQQLMQKGQAPFLHGLVKASDFYLTLEEKIDSRKDRRYIISVKSSIDQTPPREVLEWDRQNLNIIKQGLPEDLLKY